MGTIHERAQEFFELLLGLAGGGKGAGSDQYCAVLGSSDEYQEARLLCQAIRFH